MTACRCKCVVCVIPGRCHKTEPPTEPDKIETEDGDMKQLHEIKLQGPDKGADRSTRPPPMCCERIGNGSWCTLPAGHPATQAHEGSPPSYGPLRDPALKFAIGIRGRWVDPKGTPHDS